jgi:antitoxin (DNA-binding transcriptional repressor) of toxin-antitoxin stability system
MGKLNDISRRRKRARTQLLSLGSKVYEAFLAMEQAAFSDGALPRRTKDAVAPSPGRLYKDRMKTLTITEAKKNLGRWLAAAARGEDVGIVSGADVIALRKVEVESTDYARREYGVTEEQVQTLEEATDRRYQRLRRTRALVTVTASELRKMLG